MWSLALAYSKNADHDDEKAKAFELKQVSFLMKMRLLRHVVLPINSYRGNMITVPTAHENIFCFIGPLYEKVYLIRNSCRKLCVDSW